MNSKTPKTKRSKKTSKPKNVYNVSLTPARKYLDAIRDPFHPSSAGVKVPDFDGNPSYTLAAKDAYQITTDVNGAAGGVCVFGFPYYASSTGSVAAGTVTLNGGAVRAWSDYTGLLATTTCVAQRTVCGGLRFQNLMSLAGTNAAQGRLIIAPVSEPNVAALISVGVTYTESSLRKMPGAMVIPLAALAASHIPVVCSSAPLDPSAMCYVASSTSLQLLYNDSPNHVNFVYLVVGGPASQAVLEVEQVGHYEALPQLAYGPLATESIEADPGIMATAFNWISRQDPIEWGHIASRAYTAASSTGSTLANY